MGCLGWLLLMPFSIASLIAFKAVDFCIKKRIRLLGLLICLILGGFCIGLGYVIAFEGFDEWRDLVLYKVTYPIAGWVGMIFGGITILVGTWRSVAITKEQVELEERTEKLEKEREQEEKDRKEAIALAQKWLQSGKIDNFEKYNTIINFLGKRQWDHELADLSEQLKELFRRSN